MEISWTDVAWHPSVCDEIHGQMTAVVYGAPIVEGKLNPHFWASWFAWKNEVIYEPREKCWYLEEDGRWCATSAEAVLRRIQEMLLSSSRQIDGDGAPAAVWNSLARIKLSNPELNLPTIDQIRTALGGTAEGVPPGSYEARLSFRLTAKKHGQNRA